MIISKEASQARSKESTQQLVFFDCYYEQRLLSAKSLDQLHQVSEQGKQSCGEKLARDAIQHEFEEKGDESSHFR